MYSGSRGLITSKVSVKLACPMKTLQYLENAPPILVNKDFTVEAKAPNE